MNLMRIIEMGILRTFSIVISPLYILVLSIVYFQYKKAGKVEKEILGINKEPIWKRVLSSCLYGIIGGFIGSIIVISLGISVENNDFKYILPMALMLMLIHPRFLCFSYAGGILAISSLILGYPRLNVSNLIAIVAILHLIESLLIFTNGYKTKTPIFVERNGRVVGGFSMVRFWPIPFIVILATSQGIANGGLIMPNWWPLFKSSYTSLGNPNFEYMILGIIAVLGYGDISITSYPREKACWSARRLFLYSTVLLSLSIISTYNYYFKFIAALFAPIAHEFLIYKGRKKEEQGLEVFTPSIKGIKILDILPGGIGHRLGLTPGCVIFSINDNRVLSKEDIENILIHMPSHIKIDYWDIKNIRRTVEISNTRCGLDSLGVVVIPLQTLYSFEIEESKGILSRIADKFKSKSSNTSN